jgi:cytochrome b561
MAFLIEVFAAKMNSSSPNYPNSISSFVIKIASIVHCTLYGLLFILPLLAWAGVTAYPALMITSSSSGMKFFK